MSPAQIKVLIAAFLLAGAFASGWAINGWRIGAGEAAEQRKAAAAAVAALGEAVASLRESAEELATINETEAEAAAAVVATTQESRDAVRRAIRELERAGAGGCDFTGDADRLRMEAWRRATGAGAAADPAGGPARGP